MITLLGAVGWGLLACGAITHVWHHARLRELIGMHLDREVVPAAILTGIEVVLAIGIPVLVIAESPALRWVALAAALLAVGFMVWIGRLLATGSDLPCACSFSQAPTSRWSFARSVCVGLVVFFAIGDVSEITASTAESVATLFVGWAVAAFIFVLPEALAWPTASRALLARVDAHTSP